MKELIRSVFVGQDSLGVYISVPFCKAKCTYCNFASGVFGPERMGHYVEQVCAEMRGARAAAERVAAKLPSRVDSVFFGGGTPSLLGAEQMRRLFAALRGEFDVASDAEITLECAPGQLGDETLEEMLRQGMNRVSFGVQSFVDSEARAVGRLHTRAMCLAEIARMRAVGVGNINVDLIAGLPGQTAATWRESVEVALGTGVPHMSIYMLEVDEDSRLGREVLSAGNREQGLGNREQGLGNREQGLGKRLRYGAEAVPSEDESAEWYGEACGWLAADGVGQYEISNFARGEWGGWRQRDNDGDSDSLSQNDAVWGVGDQVEGVGDRVWGVGGQVGGVGEQVAGYRSRHNVKYWRREPYVGFGLDAHSMLRTAEGAVRWANADDLAVYEGQSSAGDGGLVRLGVGRAFEPEIEVVGREAGFEEAVFLGLRMNVGVDLEDLREEYGDSLVGGCEAALAEVVEAGLMERDGSRIRLTARGRMASNEVFSRLLVEAAV